MNYDDLVENIEAQLWSDFIEHIEKRLWRVINQTADHHLDEKYIASACRDYAEAIRALQQAKNYKTKGE